MKRVLQVLGALIGVLLVGTVVFFLWASSGRLSDEDLAQIRTYAPAPDTTVPDTLTVATYNIGYLSGMTNNEPVVRPDSLFYANMDQVVRFFRRIDPDIAGLQEIDFGGVRAAHVHQLDTLATRLGYPTAAQAVNWDERYLPFPYGRPAVNFGRTLSGQAVLSRFPIRRHMRKVLLHPPQPFFRDAFYLDRLAQIVLLNVGGHALGVINVHLEAFDMETREEQARTVNALYDRLTEQGLPVLLLGDFNSTLSSSDPAGASRTDPDSTMHFLLDGTDLRPVADSAKADLSRPTYPADAPTRRIDYVFYPIRFFDPTDTQQWCGVPNPPSDHCAVTVSLHVLAPVAQWPSNEAIPSLDSLLAE